MKLLPKILRVLLLTLFLVMALGPLCWMVITSLKGSREIYTVPIRYWPSSPTFENYRYLFSISNFSVYIKNSMVASLIAATGALLIAMFSGYAISRLRARKTQSTLLVAMYFTQIIPTFMLMVPLFTTLARLGLTDHILAISLVYVAMTTAFCTIMAKGFFDRIPVALEEAAMVDGCSRNQTLFRVVIPVTLPGLAAIFSFAFINTWNELFLAVMLLSSDHNMTVPVALNSFISKAGVSWGVLSAGIVVSLLPTMIVFAFAQKYIIMGLTEGAVKG